MEEFNYTVVLIVVEVIFSLILIKILNKAGATKSMLLFFGGLFIGWLGLSYTMVTQGFFSSTSNPQVAFFIAVVIPIILGVSAQKFNTSFANIIKNIDTKCFLMLQSSRVVFGILFFFTASLPIWFQYVGGIGDILAGLSAFIAFKFLTKNQNKENKAIIKGNIIGILDFIVVLNLGVFIVLENKSPDIIFNLIPLYVVPIYILLHIFSLQKLKYEKKYDR